jgi:hypothetical protein
LPFGHPDAKKGNSYTIKLASTGELPGFKIGDSWRFDMDEILEQIRDSKKQIHNNSFPIEEND